MAEYRYKDRHVGSQVPPFSIRLYFNAGGYPDLTELGAVMRFRFVNAVTGVVVLDDVLVTTRDAFGRAEYLPDVDHVSIAGDYWGQWFYTRPDGALFKSKKIHQRILPNP